MKRIVVLATGGTIAMRADASSGGAVPSLGASDFARALPAGLAAVETEEFSNLPSAHFTLDQIWGLARRAAARAAESDVDGIVVTHGTDTLEESAYLCDLTAQTDKPIVFTGAMRTASEVGYEGFANLAAAVQVAAAESARGLGTLVVFQDEIHAARDVTKTHTTAVDTFQSPEFGPLGRVDYGGILIARRPMQREFIPAPRLETSVHLLTLAVGMDVGLFEYLVNQAGARGIVLETLGGGRVPPAWLPVIERAIANGVAIVIASRVGSGRPVDRYGYPGAHRDLVRLGCWSGGGLNGPKARIKLMTALATPNPRQYFD